MQGSEKLYEEHMTLYGAYYKKLSHLEKSKYHLEQLFKILKNMFKLRKTSKSMVIESKHLKKNAESSLDLEKVEIICLLALGNLYLNIGNLTKSENILKKCLECCFKLIELNLDGQNKEFDYYFYPVLKGLGDLYMHFGNFLQAERYFLYSLKVALVFFEENNKIVADLYSCLGKVYENNEIESIQDS